MQRRAIMVQGIVQGVGFRPYVYGLASRLHLNGSVKNQAGAVLIEVEGEPSALDRFLDELERQPPPLAQINDLYWRPIAVVGEPQFRIGHSDANASGSIFISPDVATCSECLAELWDPADRRYRYPFLNCTNCGPRLTIIEGAPYDRERTTMARFVMCAACRAEYEDPADRRFHAQPTACPACGPRLEALGNQGERLETNDPVAFFAQAVLGGKIGAIKGLGGYHLVCDARDEQVVRELRRRKQRDEKPFAVMVRDVEAAERLCEIDAGERALLLSGQRPIVLLHRQPHVTAQPSTTFTVCQVVAPGHPYLGLMLPYAPLHHLLLDAVDGIPLVMTSGNRSDEPIAYQDQEALERLGPIADVFLIHNRPIHVRCDDSVTRIVDGRELPVRRSRGYAPQPIKLPIACGLPMLAVGGQFKATFALASERQAFLSHHLDDLDHFDAYRSFERDISLYQKLFNLEPQWIVHDLHPDYASTAYAERRAAAGGIQRLAVQHHHAHMASCMAEHGLDEPVIGVSFDGTGFGTDGAIWGGEFLVGDYRRYRRAAHLRYVGMPGSERAIDEPWRMAVSHLMDADCELPAFECRVSPASLRTVQAMLARRFNTPLTSSAGRLFDAVASLAGVRDRVTYEGQAAVELEWLASETVTDESYPFDVEPHCRLSDEDGTRPYVLDTRPLVRAVAEDVRRSEDSRRIARRFHSTMVELIARTCLKLRTDTGLDAVVLSGGVFLNALLTREVVPRLAGEGFRVYRHRLVPPNDGGLSLGQVAVAAASLDVTPSINNSRTDACVSAFPAK